MTPAIGHYQFACVRPVKEYDAPAPGALVRSERQARAGRATSNERNDRQFSRASGPGGQHVNKVNTRAELRLDSTAHNTGARATWPTGSPSIRRKSVSSSSAQTARTQKGNREACEAKLEESPRGGHSPKARTRGRDLEGREARRRRQAAPAGRQANRGRVDYFSTNALPTTPPPLEKRKRARGAVRGRRGGDAATAARERVAADSNLVSAGARRGPNETVVDAGPRRFTCTSRRGSRLTAARASHDRALRRRIVRSGRPRARGR